MSSGPLRIPPVDVPDIQSAFHGDDGTRTVAFATAAKGTSEVAAQDDLEATDLELIQQLTGSTDTNGGDSRKRKDGVTSKVNVASRRFFLKICHPISAEFAEAIVLPSLQFQDRNVEARFQKAHFTSIPRITYTVLFGWSLNLLQMWFGLYKGWLGINTSKNQLKSTTPPPSSFNSEHLVPRKHSALLDFPLLASFDWLTDPRRRGEYYPVIEAMHEVMPTPIIRRRLSDAGFDLNFRRGVAHLFPDTLPKPRCLWGKEEITEQLRSDAGLFEAACINQTVADSIILFIWWLFSSLKRYHKRLEAITLSVQLSRVVLIVLFAQGMWSACARNQGPTDIMMNNIALASANVTYFNCLPICRVRRASAVTAVFVVGVFEIIIVMTQGTTGGVAMSPHDAAQLTMYILIFIFIPIIALVGRFRAEVSEREVFFMRMLYDQVEEEKKNLLGELEELNKVRDMDLDQQLPEGLVPSKIVHVAVRELQQAERSAEQLHRALPSIFLQQTKITRKRHAADANADLRINTARQIGKAMEFAVEVKESVQSALKLLCRSHDLYTPPVQGNYAGAMLFHAVGHAAAQQQLEVNSANKEATDETTDGLSDGPPTLLSRNTAKRTNAKSVGHYPESEDDSKRPALNNGPEDLAGAGGSTYHVSPQLGGGDDEEESPRDGGLEGLALFGSSDFPFLSGLGEMARNIGSNWQFDILKVTKATKDESIITTGMLLASPIAEGIQFEWKRWFGFLKCVQNEYGASNLIPYHNRTHSSIHAHTCAVLLEWLKHTDHSTKLESLAVLVSSICHDVGHPGRTNAYLVNANKRLAIIYNDISVLENYHSCRTFEILMQKNNNFIHSIGLEDYRYFRKAIIELILSTDMKQHFELLNNYKLQRNTPAFDPWSVDNKLSTLKLIMKAADLSHGAFEWPLHYTLSMQVNEEFWTQGDAELAMGLPKSPLCDRAISKEELSSSQAGFLEFLVLPLYRELAAVETTSNIKDICETRILANIDRWKEQSQHKPKESPPPPAAAAANDTTHN